MIIIHPLLFFHMLIDGGQKWITQNSCVLICISPPEMNWFCLEEVLCLQQSSVLFLLVYDEKYSFSNRWERKVDNNSHWIFVHFGDTSYISLLCIKMTAFRSVLGECLNRIQIAKVTLRSNITILVTIVTSFFCLFSHFQVFHHCSSIPIFTPQPLTQVSFTCRITISMSNLENLTHTLNVKELKSVYLII